MPHRPPPRPHSQRPRLRAALKAQDYTQALAWIARGVPLAERPNAARPDLVFWHDALAMPGTAHLAWLWDHGLRPSRPALAFEALKEALLADRLDVADWWVAHGAPLAYPGPFRLGTDDRHCRPELIDALAEKGGSAGLAWLFDHAAPRAASARFGRIPMWTALYQQPPDRVLCVVDALIPGGPDVVFGRDPSEDSPTPHGVLVELARQRPLRHPPELLAQLWMRLDQACRAHGRSATPYDRQAIATTAVEPHLSIMEQAQARALVLEQRPAVTRRPRLRA